MIARFAGTEVQPATLGKLREVARVADVDLDALVMAELNAYPEWLTNDYAARLAERLAAECRVEV